MNWNTLNDIAQIEQIDAESNDQLVMILKHSTRCSISSSALARLERNWKSDSTIKPYYLDLLAYRPISNFISEHYHIEHQSPQVLLIKNGKCIYHESHVGIQVDELEQVSVA